MRWLILITALVTDACAQQQPGDRLLYEQTREGVDRILAESSAKGVRRITVVILTAGEPKRNVYGEFAMGYGGQGHEDVSLPNPAFFQHLDWVLKRAASKRIEVGILAAERGTALAAVNSRERFFEWGRYLGRRYMKAKGLVWLKPAGGSAGPLDAIEEGIRQFDTVHPTEEYAVRPPAAAVARLPEPSSLRRTCCDDARRSSFASLPAVGLTPIRGLSARLRWVHS
jgi:hypothetical protein